MCLSSRGPYLDPTIYNLIFNGPVFQQFSGFRTGMRSERVLVAGEMEEDGSVLLAALDEKPKN